MRRPADHLPKLLLGEAQALAVFAHDPAEMLAKLLIHGRYDKEAAGSFCALAVASTHNLIVNLLAPPPLPALGMVG